MATNLPLAHKPQQDDGYCLPACVQMVFAYLGISRTQDAIAKALGLNLDGSQLPEIKPR